MRTLEGDVSTLGRALGAVIREQEGQAFFELEERARLSTKKLRELRAQPGTEAEARHVDELLAAELARVSSHDAERLVRAFSCYFLLINVAEEHARVFRAEHTAREVRKESLEQACRTLANEGHDAESARRLLRSVELGLTFTAHPTEMRRRTIRGHLQAIASLVPTLERPDALERITAHIEALWGTPRLRDRKPEVRDEVNAGLAYVDVIAQVLPDLERDLERSFAAVYGESTRIPVPLSIHSWMGGDRDGNPNVTSAVTRETFAHHEKLARRGLEREIVTAFAHLSQASSDPSTGDHGEAEHFRALAQKAHDAFQRDDDHALSSSLESLEKALEERSQRRSLDWLARPLFVRHRVFGRHLASLDVREHSRVTGEAVAELLTFTGIHDYTTLSEDEKRRVLVAELATARPLKPVSLPESAALEAVLGPLRAAKDACARTSARAFGRYIVSMSEDLSDLLEVLVLSREVGVSVVPVPLFETLDDLRRAPEVMRAALRTPVYRAAVADRVQEIMIGYSDSNKDAGFVAASWALYVAQERITHVCKELGVRHRFFHGRGTSIGRGGGPMARGMLGQPPGTVGEGIRITEQGEALSDRYSHPALARRNLEQGLYGLIVAAGRKREPLDPRFGPAMDAAADASVRVYRALVQDEAFLPFFEAVTPIGEIAKLRIASRPVRRPGSATLKNLRAIPWVMAWTQCRANVPGWFGLGPALEVIRAHGDDLGRTMYESWPFFRSMLDNAQMALAKTDLDVFRMYQSLHTGAGLALGRRIEDEHKRAVRAVTELTGRPLMESEPRLRRSIALRNPYIEPMHRLQIELLRKARAIAPADTAESTLPSDLERALVLSLHGIAAGMRNTG